MTYIYNEKAKNLNVGKLGHYIIFWDNEAGLGDVFIDIAELFVKDKPADLLDWAGNHLDEVKNIFDVNPGLYHTFCEYIQHTQFETFYNDLYNHKSDILLFYAYTYMEKNKIELDSEKLEQLEEYIKTVETDNKLEDIENYCDELNK